MLGFIARCDNTGLGMESLEIVRHLAPDKLLVAIPHYYSDRPERMASCPNVVYLDRAPTREEIDAFLTDLDTVLCLESPYDWNVIRRAKARRIRIVLRINYECLEDPLPVVPDVIIAPVDWYQPAGSVILPFPVDRGRFRFKQRKRARTFLHVAGHHGMYGRNGTTELLEAIPLVRADVRFIIYSQIPMNDIGDGRLSLRIADVEDNSSLYAEGDMMVLPRRFGGQSLPLSEALSVGMPVLMTDMLPQNKLLPRELLIRTSSTGEVRLNRTVKCARASPKDIARAIDSWADKDISAFSLWANNYAETISWTRLLTRYREILRPAHSCVA